MTINIEELKRDHEAGTPGPWENKAHPESIKADAVFAGGKRVAYCLSMFGRPHVPHSHDAINARRIARVPDLEAAFLEAVERQERQYHVGPLTFDRVFRAGQLENLYDMQAVLDAVERALEAE